MLEYAKTILRKVSFDRQLFEKELKKAMKLLMIQEVKELKEWCYVHFGHLYKTILNRNFKRIEI